MIWEVGIKELENAGYDIEYNIELGRSRGQLLSVISEYDALIVRNETIVDSELLAKGTNLKVIGRLGVGLDNIDLESTKAKDIKVVFAKHANATSVAEYVIAAMVDTYRKIQLAATDVKKGNWNRRLYTGTELNGKTLGLYGLGEISHRVAKRANAFGMKLIGYDPFVSPYDHIVTESEVKQLNSVNELLTQSDFISIHVPLTKSTKNIFNTKTFSQMKSSAYIINTARGGIINEDDLSVAVLTNEIAGAYLDVIETEPISVDSPLLTLDSITVTPHIAGLTEESQVRTSLLVAQETAKVLKGDPSFCTV